MNYNIKWDKTVEFVTDYLMSLIDYWDEGRNRSATQRHSLAIITLHRS